MGSVTELGMAVDVGSAGEDSVPARSRSESIRRDAELDAEAGAAPYCVEEGTLVEPRLGWRSVVACAE